MANCEVSVSENRPKELVFLSLSNVNLRLFESVAQTVIPLSAVSRVVPGIVFNSSDRDARSCIHRKRSVRNCQLELKDQIIMTENKIYPHGITGFWRTRE